MTLQELEHLVQYRFVPFLVLDAVIGPLAHQHVAYVDLGVFALSGCHF